MRWPLITFFQCIFKSPKLLIALSPYKDLAVIKSSNNVHESYNLIQQ